MAQIIELTPQEILDEQISQAIADFNQDLAIFTYEAVLHTSQLGERYITVYFGDNDIAEFCEADGPWLDQLNDYGFRLENGAMAA